jgi:hypothetical protein
MVNCSVCGADITNNPVKEGVSKKNNKPYRMIKCNCGGATFLPFGKAEKPKVFAGTTPAPAIATDFSKIIMKLTDIEARIVAMSKKQDDFIAKSTSQKQAQVNVEVDEWASVKPEDINFEE